MPPLTPELVSILKKRRLAAGGHKRVRFGKKATYFIPLKEDTKTYIYH